MNARQAALVLCGMLVSVATACASGPVHEQSFVRLRTPHFEIVSSLGDAETRELAIALELFHAGIEHALGLPYTESAALPTPVFAFDDRVLARPFAVRGAKAYLVPRVSGLALVLRTPLGWDEEATLRLRGQYAHALLRSRSASALPLWIEEGLSQFASTVEVRAPNVQVGRVVPGHVAQLRDWSVKSLDRTLETEDLADATEPQRRKFEARAWALVHYLRSAGSEGDGRGALERYAAALDAEGPEAARRTLGHEGAALAKAIDAHIRQRALPIEQVHPRWRWDVEEVETSRLPRDESRAALAELALDLERSELAVDLYRRALADNPQNSEAHAGLARAVAAQGNWEGAEIQRGRALAQGSALAKVERDVGGSHLLQAEGEPGAGEAPLRDARLHLERSVALDDRDPTALSLLARSSLLAGADAEIGLEWLASARALRPGSLELELLRARLEVKLGREATARARVRDVLSRTHWPRTERAGRDLLMQLPPPGAP